MWAYFGVLGLDLGRFRPFFGVVILDLGQFGTIWRILGLDLGQFMAISGILGLDWAYSGLYGHIPAGTVHTLKQS